MDPAHILPCRGPGWLQGGAEWEAPNHGDTRRMEQEGSVPATGGQHAHLGSPRLPGCP